MTPDQLLAVIDRLTRLADELETLQIQLMRALPNDAMRGNHLYEAAHGLGAAPNMIRRSRGHVVLWLRGQGQDDDL